MDAYHKWNKSVRPLTLGLFISLIFTLASYFAVTKQLFVGWPLVAVIVAFGSLQATAQLFYFLHLGLESKPRWNLVTFLFMLLILIVVVGGSMWIMYNLNYHMEM
jgi:cytochrome o ubiquinol oxidase subunit IV